jgi:hypothetical protein
MVGVANFTEIGVPAGPVDADESSSSQSSSPPVESLSGSSSFAPNVEVGAGAEALLDGVEAVASAPVMPPETPVAAKRARASS